VLYAAREVYITSGFDRDCRRAIGYAARLRIANSAGREPTFPLFLLFLQEIISERDRLHRRNPGVPMLRRGKEQRIAPAQTPVNSAKDSVAAYAFREMTRSAADQTDGVAKLHILHNLSKGKSDGYPRGSAFVSA
jgi:hypothetical protein